MYCTCYFHVLKLSHTCRLQVQKHKTLPSPVSCKMLSIFALQYKIQYCMLWQKDCLSAFLHSLRYSRLVLQKVTAGLDGNALTQSNIWNCKPCLCASFGFYCFFIVWFVWYESLLTHCLSTLEYVTLFLFYPPTE